MKHESDSAGIYENTEDDSSEVSAAIRAASVGLRAGGPAVFRVESGERFEDCWQRWVAGDFTAVHGPHLAAVHGEALAGGAIEIAALDGSYGRWFSAALGEEVNTASLRAGADVLEALTGARHVRLVAKLSEAVEEGSMAGHFATLLGCHAAVINVGLAHALMALAYLEWKLAGGLKRLPAGVSGEAGFGHDAEDAGLADAVGRVLRDGQGQGGALACA